MLLAQSIPIKIKGCGPWAQSARAMRRILASRCPTDMHNISTKSSVEMNVSTTLNTHTRLSEVCSKEQPPQDTLTQAHIYTCMCDSRFGE